MLLLVEKTSSSYMVPEPVVDGTPLLVLGAVVVVFGVMVADFGTGFVAGTFSFVHCIDLSTEQPNSLT